MIIVTCLAAREEIGLLAAAISWEMSARCSLGLTGLDRGASLLPGRSGDEERLFDKKVG